MRTRPLPNLRRAFTLVELLIVIIIIAVLAAIAIPKFANSSQKSKESSLRANLKVARSAVEMFKMDTGLLPLTVTDLTVTTPPSNGANAAGTSVSLPAGSYKGPYIASVPNDPVANAALTYSYAVGANQGKVLATASGTDSDGVNFSTY